MSGKALSSASTLPHWSSPAIAALIYQHSNRGRQPVYQAAIPLQPTCIQPKVLYTNYRTSGCMYKGYVLRPIQCYPQHDRTRYFAKMLAAISVRKRHSSHKPYCCGESHEPIVGVEWTVEGHKPLPIYSKRMTFHLQITPARRHALMLIMQY